MVLFVLEKLKNIWMTAYILLIKMFTFLGGITLEIYLFHQSYMIVFDFPADSYIFVAVILPVMTSSIIFVMKRQGMPGKKR